MSAKKSIIFSLGGSIIVPDMIDVDFLKKFKDLISKYSDQYDQFFIVTGGGKTARRYQEAADLVNSPDPEDLDWLGIHATRLNGHLMRTIFKGVADPQMITSEEKLTPRDAKIVIVAGFRPGNSTDYVATLVAKAYGISKILNLSNIAYVFDKDPNKFDDAKPLKSMSWPDLKQMVGDKWVPGTNVPFDPKATSMAGELGLEVVVMNGTDLENLENLLKGEGFEGTTIL